MPQDQRADWLLTKNEDDCTAQCLAAHEESRKEIVLNLHAFLPVEKRVAGLNATRLWSCPARYEPEFLPYVKRMLDMTVSGEEIFWPRSDEKSFSWINLYFSQVADWGYEYSEWDDSFYKNRDMEKFFDIWENDAPEEQLYSLKTVARWMGVTPVHLAVQLGKASAIAALSQEFEPDLMAEDESVYDDDIFQLPPGWQAGPGAGG